MNTQLPYKKRHRPGRGALWLIAILLFSSGALRISNGAGVAMARGVDDLLVAEAGMGDPATCQPPDDIAAILAALNVRENALKQKEAALADRLSALALAEGEITRNITALEAAETRLSATLAIADQATEGDLDRLTAVYESMKPKDAAALFQEMSPDFAAGFLGRMRSDAAAAVMAGLDPQTAYTISVMLAGRNANAPTK